MTGHGRPRCCARDDDLPLGRLWRRRRVVLRVAGQIGRESRLITSTEPAAFPSRNAAPTLTDRPMSVTPRRNAISVWARLLTSGEAERESVKSLRRSSAALSCLPAPLGAGPRRPACQPLRPVPMRWHRHAFGRPSRAWLCIRLGDLARLLMGLYSVYPLFLTAHAWSGATVSAGQRPNDLMTG